MTVIGCVGPDAGWLLDAGPVVQGYITSIKLVQLT